MSSHLLLVGSFVALIANSVLACGAGTGALNTKATLSFNIAPPLLWAHGDGTGLSNTEAEAKRTAESDITNAITRTLLDQDVDSTGMKIDVTYTPLEVAGLQATANTVCGATEDKTYTPYSGTLLYDCSGEKPTMTHSQGSVTITSPNAIFESQWQGLATLVQEKLEKKHVVFQDEITIKH